MYVDYVDKISRLIQQIKIRNMNSYVFMVIVNDLPLIGKTLIYIKTL